MYAYVYKAALLCEACGSDRQAAIGWASQEAISGDSDHYPQGPYSNGGGEADCPQHCDQCHTFLENPLTSDGEEYVKTWYSDGAPALKEWRDFYSYLFDAE